MNDVLPRPTAGEGRGEGGRMNQTIHARLTEAKASLDEAQTLIVQDAEINFVMNSLYYAFLYPVLGLLHDRGLSLPTQAEAIELFDKEFVQKGVFEQKFLAALRIAFELRPACSCEGHRKTTHQDVEGLLPLAEEFLLVVREYAG